MLRLWENLNPNSQSSPTLIEINSRWQHGHIRDLQYMKSCLFELSDDSFMPGRLLAEAYNIEELLAKYPEYFI